MKHRIKITNNGEISDKHPLYLVENTGQNDFLGWIQYWPDWKRYVFSPDDETFYSPECLMEISEFLFDLNIPREKTHAMPKHVKPLGIVLEHQQKR